MRDNWVLPSKWRNLIYHRSAATQRGQLPPQLATLLPRGTLPATPRKRPGKPAYGEAKAAAGDSRSQWCPTLATETTTEWYAKDEPWNGNEPKRPSHRVCDETF